LAEATWGIVQGWEQMSLYEDIMQPTDESRFEGLGLVPEDEVVDEEEELERKVEALERMRGRRGKSAGESWLISRSGRSHWYTISRGYQLPNRADLIRTYRSLYICCGGSTLCFSTSA